jgi:hypothetical protein
MVRIYLFLKSSEIYAITVSELYKNCKIGIQHFVQFSLSKKHQLLLTSVAGEHRQEKRLFILHFISTSLNISLLKAE